MMVKEYFDKLDKAIRFGGRMWIKLKKGQVIRTSYNYELKDCVQKDFERLVYDFQHDFPDGIVIIHAPLKIAIHFRCNDEPIEIQIPTAIYAKRTMRVKLLYLKEIINNKNIIYDVYYKLDPNYVPIDEDSVES